TLIGSKRKLYQLLESDWETLKHLFPEVRVVSTDTGFSRTYGVSPYGNYKTDHDFFLFPVDKDPRLRCKEKVLAILN
ncbi:DUF3179 domain-containing (seleno)protein, partial [Flagellimonas flava]|uniref:DUF3179 domain-containing (seleno)protein n=1 Tax=Flagellimonas flava TaxID=570519 RepID=UPI003D65614A